MRKAFLSFSLRARRVPWWIPVLLSAGSGTLFAEALRFTENLGQWNEQALFHASVPGGDAWFTSTGVVYRFIRATSAPDPRNGPGIPHAGPPADLEMLVVSTLLVGSSETVQVQGLLPMPHLSHYFLGDDPSGWRTGVPSFGMLLYRNIYSGIDLEYDGRDGGLKYSFIVQPGADPSAIRIRYLGVTSATLAPSGELRMGTPWGVHVEGAPVAFQHVEGRQVMVPCSYNLLADDCFGYSVAGYDPSLPLIIDPLVSLEYGTYLGGSSVDGATAIAVDAGGSAYVTGWTLSANFPLQNPFQGSFAGGTYDMFVTKFTPGGDQLAYSTYLGGSDDDVAYAITVDAGGNAYVAGYSASTDYPVLNPVQGANAGGKDVVVTKLSPSGNPLVYSTYLGGADEAAPGYGDEAYGLALHSSGALYVAGRTNSLDFPVHNAYQPQYGGGYQDAFLAGLSPDGTALLFSTYLGGSELDEGYGAGVDPEGNVFIAGYTTSSDFPVLNAFQSAHGGYADAFLAKISPDGASLFTSTYLGGSGYDYARALAVDPWGRPSLAGGTESADFPVKDPFQGTPNEVDGFVTRMTADGSQLSFSTFYGGSGFDWVQGVATDAEGCVYLTGYTTSMDFPLASPFQAGFGGGIYDAWVAKLYASGSQPVYSTYLGGSDSDTGWGIAVDPAGHAYVTGNTGSPNFPTQNPFQGTRPGTSAAFVAKFSGAGTGIEPDDPAPGTSPALSFPWVSPNPFSGTAHVHLRVPVHGHVDVFLHGLDGRSVAEVSSGIMTRGLHHLTLETRDLPEGVYFLRAAGPGSASAVHKVLLLR